MTRRTMPAVGLTAAALILLTACGGGDGDNGSDKIQGGATTTPSTSETPGVQRPTITFPSYAKNVFEDQQTGDSKKDAVLADDAQSVNSVDDAIFRHTLDSPALRFYNKGLALQGHSITSGATSRRTIAGRARLASSTVRSPSAATAPRR